MKRFYFIVPILLTVIGVLALVGGELDDAPGLGGIGFIFILTAAYLNFKLISKKPNL